MYLFPIYAVHSTDVMNLLMGLDIQERIRIYILIMALEELPQTHWALECHISRRRLVCPRCVEDCAKGPFMECTFRLARASCQSWTVTGLGATPRKSWVHKVSYTIGSYHTSNFSRHLFLYKMQYIAHDWRKLAYGRNDSCHMVTHL